MSAKTGAAKQASREEGLDELPREVVPKHRGGRQGVEVMPEMLSQLTVLAVCGISPRVYLELLRAEGFSVRVIKLGKLRLVRREEFVAWLESLAASKETPPREKTALPPPEEDPDAIDDFIGRLGFRPAISQKQQLSKR